MAGSHTMMPGIIFSGNTVLNVTNANSGLPNNPQSVSLPFSHSSLNGGVGINGHTNNVITTTSILRPANKIIVQGTPNNLTLVHSQSNSQIFSSLNQVIQSNNGLIEKDTGHGYINLLSRFPDSNKKLEVINSSVPFVHTLNSPGIHAINSSGIYTVNSSAIRSINCNSEVQSVNSLVHTVPLSAVHSNTSHAADFHKDKESEDSDIEEIPQTEEVEEEDEEPVIDIMINNVVCSFSVGCHLDLRNIALTARNVEFRKENGMVTLKLRRPQTTASIWSSGKITCTGSTSEDQARIAARRVARALQKLGYNVKFRNYRIVNVLGTCTMPFAIKIANFSQMHKKSASYEPELHPGVTYRIETPKATLKIFSTGSITVTAPSVSNVQSAIETIYPLVKDFSKQRSPEELSEIRRLQKRRTLKEEEDNDLSEDEDI